MTTKLVPSVRAAIAAALMVSLAGCGGGPAQQPTVAPTGSGGAPTATAAVAGKTATTATPGAAAKPTAAQAGSGQATDASGRIADSANRLLMDEKAAFKSFHVEASGTDPSYDSTAKKLASETFTLKADSAGKDLYLVYSESKAGASAKTTEGYAMNGGMGGDNGKEYVVEGGKLKESMGAVSMTWVFFPLRVVLPLSIAGMGPTAQGSESIDGRAADKFAVDSANAPAGTMGALGAFLTVTSAKGTVWIDKETGALLKCSLDYEQNFTDAPGSKTVVANGKGHIELVVTKVNSTSVKLPQ